MRSGPDSDCTLHLVDVLDAWFLSRFSDVVCCLWLSEEIDTPTFRRLLDAARAEVGVDAERRGAVVAEDYLKLVRPSEDELGA
jgi:hypothetical protein